MGFGEPVMSAMKANRNSNESEQKLAMKTEEEQNLTNKAKKANTNNNESEQKPAMKVVKDILSVVSHVSLSFDSIGDASFENLYRRNRASSIRDVMGNFLAYEEKCKSLILKSSTFIADVTLEFDTLNINMDGSRGNHTSGSNRKTNGASSSVSSQNINPTKYGKPMRKMLPLPKFGLGMSVQQSFIRISPEGGSLKVRFIFSGIRSIIFRGQRHTRKNIDESVVRKLFHESVNCLYESYLPSCMFSIFTDPPEGSVLSGGIWSIVDAYGPGGSQHSVTAETLDGPELTILHEGSEIQSGNNISHTGLLQPTSSVWFLVVIGLDGFFIAESSKKDAIFGVHQANKLQISLSIGKEFHTMFCEIQVWVDGHVHGCTFVLWYLFDADGLFVLETAALAKFIEGFREYVLYIKNFSNVSSGRPYETFNSLIAKSENLARQNDDHSIESFSGSGSLVSSSATFNTSPESTWKFPMNLTIGLSKLSLVLVTADGSGGISELVLEADFRFLLELFNSRRKLMFNLFRLSILSQNVRAKSLQRTETGVLVPHFQSSLPDHSSSPSGYYRPSRPLQHTESILPVLDSKNENFEGVSGFYHLNPGSDIVKEVTASIMVEKAMTRNESLPIHMKSDWVGSGSISGFNLTITLSEIEATVFVQTILDIFTPLFEVSSKETRGNLEQKFGSRYQEQDSVLENTIPDENKYQLVGAVHYSLAGERALFRTDAGEALRLNFRPGSDFVDVSGIDDTGWALWGRLPYEPESNEGDNYPESYNQLARKAFYLVNKKNDCGVAFIDGLPEFVKKPGHPFKDIRCLSVPNAHIDRRSETNAGDSFSNADNDFNCSPYIDIKTGVITLTILHELSEVNDRFPLLYGCVNGFQLYLLVTSSKTRLISTFTAAIHNHDSRENHWREIVSPIEAFVFYRSKSHSIETTQQGVPVSFHFAMKQVDVSLTELSLDVLLFSAGKLNLAGPYAVKSAMIFPNRCKVENLSGLTILCHFDDNQDVNVNGNESLSFFLR
ncbi:hypothetical protein ACLOJK_041189 [Asimina triloba]